MPIVKSNAGLRVLVTGGNGFIGIWVVRFLLEQGYTVLGALRSLDRGKKVREYFAPYGDKVQWLVVEDITKASSEGAFDDAVTKVDAIIHMASPANVFSAEPIDFVKVAVDGTTSILRSAVKFGTQVKRVVVTSSCAAVVDRSVKQPAIYNEENWGDEVINVPPGKKAEDLHPIFHYTVSKVLAEKAVWKLYNDHKAEIGWDLVIINPPLVLGPTLLDPKTPADLNASLVRWWDMTSSEKSDDDLKSTYAYVDVRDVATTHVLALSTDEAGGERIITSSGAITYQETGDVLYTLRPELFASGIIHRGNPDVDKTVSINYDPAKRKRIFGDTYRTKEVIFLDTLADFQARGWLEPRK
ncbi:D-lactaldehyde dehydrogenase [Gymnopilus junonius]|uniref:D-lactaldehyde dehydrogenase n=1 Tax=Gymnopilus junonius TaxID=109634 RepID=A0A9P5NLL9_GYMJU|nr:D-lactaldehyde dehydrogenase [Gymnopilus junonius]